MQSGGYIQTRGPWDAWHYIQTSCMHAIKVCLVWSCTEQVPSPLVVAKRMRAHVLHVEPVYSMQQ